MTLSPTSPLRAELRDKWGWFLALGLILFVFGIIASANILTATAVTVFWIGILMIAAGIVEIVHAFAVKGWGNTLLALLAGLLYTVAGILTFSNPTLAAGALTLFLGVALIVAGLVRIIYGFAERPLEGWGWMVVAGIVTILAGAIIVSGWPYNSLWILGLFLAVDLVVQGLSYIFLSLSIRNL